MDENLLVDFSIFLKLKYELML